MSSSSVRSASPGPRRGTPRHAWIPESDARLGVVDPAPGEPEGSAAVDAVGPAERVPEGERRAGRSAAIMASGTLVSRVLGFVRAALLTVAIGATGTMVDVFEMANSLPNVIYMLLVGGVFNVVLVPQLIKHAKDADRGADYTSRLMTLAGLVMLGATGLIVLAAAPIMGALTRAWSPEMLQMGTVFALWCLPQVFFYGMYALVGQVLNANGRFGAYMWAPVLNNVVAIGTLLLYIGMFGAYAGQDRFDSWTGTQTLVLAGGHTLGVVLQALILFLPLRSLGLGLRPRFGWRGMGLRHTGRIAGYTLVTMAVSNVVLLLTQRYISTATEARRTLSEHVPGTEAWADPFAQAAIPGLAAYNLALLITVLPHSVFVLSLATVYFNRLARSMDAGDLPAVRDTTRLGLRLFAVPLLFCFAAIVVLAGPLGRLFGSTADTARVAGLAVGAMILLMALSIPFRSGSFYLLRVFYAAEDPKVPMVVQISTSVVALGAATVGALLLPGWTLGLVVAGAATLGHVYQFVVAHVLTVRRFGDYGTASVLRAYAQTGLAGLAAGVAGAVVVWLMGGYSSGFAWDSIGTAVLTCAAAAAVMGPVYLLVLRVQGFPELQAALGPLARRVPGMSRVLGAR
ncbi:murein biosynthesis integral membrane protein MurJ [Micrococcus sp.]|uniref:murein biosynthesis integral membrane protein MurJ n=1 Tax=Micrococcus sp. TaxID=1271 RepID=UPI002A90B98A|nr:lipid II flippase MurJ [Micrococcus sp.]MDY6054554.1 lipid II flippase MurJ [Micrococcus sp.]